MTTEHPITDPLEPAAVETTPTAPAARSSRSRAKRVLAAVAGVAMVPALYGAASAVTGGGERPSVSAAAGADDPATHDATGTEVEVEHGVTTVTPDDDTPEVTVPTVPEHETDDTTPPAPTTPTVPDDSAPAADAPSPQTFASAGGSISVTLADGTLTLNGVSPADGFTSEVHDGGGERVEVRFFDADGKEWRIRIEVAGDALTQEITFHG